MDKSDYEYYLSYNDEKPIIYINFQLKKNIFINNSYQLHFNIKVLNETAIFLLNETSFVLFNNLNEFLKCNNSQCFTLS